jgi:DNA repair exonuclease SbcCD ATPase subunit
MPARSMQQQHRAQRDTNRKELQDVKSENRSLKKKIKRLEKQLNISESSAQEATWDAEEDENHIEIPASASKNQCPLCESTDLGTFKTPGGKTLVGCKKCRKYKAVI